MIRLIEAMRASVDVIYGNTFHTFNVDISSPGTCLFQEIFKHFNISGSYDDVALVHSNRNIIFVETPLILLERGAYLLQTKSETGNWYAAKSPIEQMIESIRMTSEKNDAYITSKQLGILLTAEYFMPYTREGCCPWRNRLICIDVNNAFISCDRFWKRFDLPVHRELQRWKEKNKILRAVSCLTSEIRRSNEQVKQHRNSYIDSKRKMNEIIEEMNKKTKQIVALQNKLSAL